MVPVSPADESAHPAGDPAGWGEWWQFHFVDPGTGLAGYACMTLVTGPVPGPGPARSRCWFWAGVVGAGRETVALSDLGVPPPRGDGLEIRSSGLWAEMTCEEPLDHWSVGLEALALAYDDPLEGWGEERGIPTPLGFDLGWESDREPYWVVPPSLGSAGAVPEGEYAQTGPVVGEVLCGAQRLGVDGWGRRSHGWGRGGPVGAQPSIGDDSRPVMEWPSGRPIDSLVLGYSAIAVPVIGTTAVQRVLEEAWVAPPPASVGGWTRWVNPEPRHR
ncbi:MAG: hypothetical protein ACT4OS_05400 [Acidimicrobiales bacterium]